MSSPLFRFALIADSHLTEPESATLLNAAIEAIHREPPDFVVFAGDMVDLGTEVQDALLLEALCRLQVPYHILPGNHDLGNVGQATHYCRTFGPLNSAWTIAGYHCLALDTTNTDPNPDNWHGFVEAPAFLWLQNTLANIPADTPLLLFSHHGLVGRSQDLTCDVGNAAEVLALFEGRRLVAGFAGHAHRLALHWWGEAPFLTAPALSMVRENHGCPPGFLWVDVLPGRVRVRVEVAGL